MADPMFQSLRGIMGTANYGQDDALFRVLSHFEAALVAPQPAAHSGERDAALTDDQKRILAFLWGIGEIDGCGFGDRHPRERGLYWWRKHLHAAFPAVNDHFGSSIAALAEGGSNA